MADGEWRMRTVRGVEVCVRVSAGNKLCFCYIKLKNKTNFTMLILNSDSIILFSLPNEVEDSDGECDSSEQASATARKNKCFMYCIQRS